MKNWQIKLSNHPLWNWTFCNNIISSYVSNVLRVLYNGSCHIANFMVNLLILFDLLYNFKERDYIKRMLLLCRITMYFFLKIFVKKFGMILNDFRLKVLGLRKLSICILRGVQLVTVSWTVYHYFIFVWITPWFLIYYRTYPIWKFAQVSSQVATGMCFFNVHKLVIKLD